MWLRQTRPRTLTLWPIKAQATQTETIRNCQWLTVNKISRTHLLSEVSISRRAKRMKSGKSRRFKPKISMTSRSRRVCPNWRDCPQSLIFKKIIGIILTTSPKIKGSNLLWHPSTPSTTQAESLVWCLGIYSIIGPHLLPLRTFIIPKWNTNQKCLLKARWKRTRFGLRLCQWKNLIFKSMKWSASWIWYWRLLSIICITTSPTQLPIKCTKAFSLWNRLQVQLRISRNQIKAPMWVDMMECPPMTQRTLLPQTSVKELKHTSTTSFADTKIGKRHSERKTKLPTLRSSVNRCSSHLLPSCLRCSRPWGCRIASAKGPNNDISSQLLALRQPINVIRIYLENLYSSRACPRRPLLLKTMQSCRRPTAIPLIR